MSSDRAGWPHAIIRGRVLIPFAVLVAIGGWALGAQDATTAFLIVALIGAAALTVIAAIGWTFGRGGPFEVSMHSSLPCADVIAAAVSILGKAQEVIPTTITRLTGEARARTKPSWRSFGEQLLIEVSEDGTDGCQVRVRSEPLIGWARVDFGRNKANVARLVKAMGLPTSAIHGR